MMPIFKVEYKDPETEEIVVEERVFEGSEDDPTMTAEEWAKDYAYTMADKGWNQVTEIKPRRSNMSTKDKEVATIDQGSTALALPEDLLAKLAADAKDTAALERPKSGSVTLRAGILSYNGQPVKGNVLRCVILAASHLNTYYEGDWDPDNISAPTCYAVNTDGIDMAPDENVFTPINPTCTGCPKAVWGSAGGKSRGKACKETRRLILIPEDALETAEDVKKAELAMIKIPVTSVGAWGNFVNALAATLQLPHYAVVTEITTTPDAKTQFKVHITPVKQINNIEVLTAVMAKREEAIRAALVGYDLSESVAPTTAAKF